MPRYKIILIHGVASFVYRIRRTAIRRSHAKWVVVTGSVGKTIARQTIATMLREVGQTVVSPTSSYVNELGVLCALCSVTDFSFWSPRAWWRLLMNPVVSTGYICIELGADFRLDIPWFLKRFTPYLVVVTARTSQDWTGIVPRVEKTRAKLVAAASGYVLTHESSVGIDYSDVYSFPLYAAEEMRRREGFNNNQTITPFHLNRLEIFSAGASYVVRDTYKVTPLCLEFSLHKALDAIQQKKIFIMTEIRPLLVHLPLLYKNSVPLLRQFDEVYFIGDPQVFRYLQSELPLSYVELADVDTFTIELTARIESGEPLAIGIKTAQFYKMPSLESFGR
jgi:hypothetical protein